MKFAIDQEVWVYDPPVMPLSAVVTSVDDIMGYRCEFRLRWAFLKKKSFSEHQLFARPEEWQRLVARLQEDAYTAAAEAEKIERKYKGDDQ